MPLPHEAITLFPAPRPAVLEPNVAAKLYAPRKDTTAASAATTSLAVNVPCSVVRLQAATSGR